MYEALRRVEGEFEAELVVETGLRVGVSVGKDIADGPDRLNERTEIGVIKEASRSSGGEVAFGGQLGGAQLLKAGSEHVGGRASLDGGDEALDLLVGIVERAPRGLDAGVVRFARRLGFGERGNRVVEVDGVEHGGDPLVESGHDLVLAQVDRGGVVDLGGERVLGRHPAAQVAIRGGGWHTLAMICEQFAVVCDEVVGDPDQQESIRWWGRCWNRWAGS